MKYLFKVIFSSRPNTLVEYVYKGGDRATAEIDDDDDFRNEIKEFVDARYITSNEACWRIFGFELHDKTPNVVALDVEISSVIQKKAFL